MTSIENSEAFVMDPWQQIREIRPDVDYLQKHRIIAHQKTHQAFLRFDLLRTKILGAMTKQKWTRIGISSATPSCGKTFVSVNLAFTFARADDCKAILLDFDLQNPSIDQQIGVHSDCSIRPFLSGQVPPEDYLIKCGKNLAFGTNSEVIDNATELIQSPRTSLALAAMTEALRPNVILFDLPPMLVADHVIALLPHVDCVLLVAAGNVTKGEDINKCLDLLREETECLGVILNKGEDKADLAYGKVKRSYS